MTLPRTRNSEIVQQDLGKELLIYDSIVHKAYALNETSKIVYRACSEQKSFEDLKRKHKFSDEIIFLALDDLQKNNLLDEKTVYRSPFAGMSRRDAIRKAGLASLVALPVISALVAPTSTHAASSTCDCPSDEPPGCIALGFYELGCFPDETSCTAAASSSAATHCCVTSVSFYDPDSQCCAVNCRAPV